MYPIRSIMNKVLYNKFVEQKLQKSRGWQKNSIKFNLHQDQWQTIFMHPHNLKVENKVKDLQYKIIHHCVTTNSMLYNMKIKAYNTCDWCHFQEETIEHLFVECHIIKNLWLDIQKNLNKKYNFRKTLSTYDILFGINEQENRTVNDVNIIIIQVKFYIWRAKKNGQNCIP